MSNFALTSSGAMDVTRINPRDYTNTLMAEAQRVGIIAESHVEAVRTKLLTALAEVIGYYTKNESSSIKAETARKLSLSLIYNIDTYLRTLGDHEKALTELLERQASELYGKGYLINKKHFEDARHLYGRVRFTRPQTTSADYDKLVDVYFKNYLSDYDPRFFSGDKIYISMPKLGFVGAYRIDGAVEVLRQLLKMNEGEADVVIR